jgi:hypothetical protein
MKKQTFGRGGFVSLGVALNPLGILSGHRPLVKFSQEFNSKDADKYVLVK